MYLEAFDDLVVRTAAFQVGPADEVFTIAREVAVPIHEAGIHRITLGVDGFLGGVLAYDGLFVTDGDKLTVFHGKGLSF